jgi:outer membrane protein TolC
MKRRMMRTWLVASLAVAGVAQGSEDGGDLLRTGLTLELALERAVRTNPNLAGIQSRYEAMAAIPSQVGTLPDPVLSFGAVNFPTDTFHVGQEPMTQLQVGISQTIPFPGKRALREAASSHEAEAARSSVAETRLRLIRDVSFNWWTLHYLDRAQEIVQRNQELLRQFVQIAKTRYEVGGGLQQDVLLAQLELSKLLDQAIQLNGARDVEAARLNRLLDQPANQPIELPRTPVGVFPDLVAQQELYQRGAESRPLLKRLRSEIDAAESRLELARKDYYPDFTVGAAYGARSGENPMPGGGDRTDLLTLRVSVNLPIYQSRKRAQAVSQRRSEMDRHRYALQDEVNAMRAEISQAVADYRRAREQLVLLDSGIIPQARHTVQSMLAGYQVGDVDFLNLVRSQVTLYNYETLYWKAVTLANQSVARLSAAVGEEVRGG